jgi:hypothetical protein
VGLTLDPASHRRRSRPSAGGWTPALPNARAGCRDDNPLSYSERSGRRYPRSDHLAALAQLRQLRSDPAREPVQTVAIRRRREVAEQLTLIRHQADVDPLPAQIQTSVQHQSSPFSDRGNIKRPARHVP